MTFEDEVNKARLLGAFGVTEKEVDALDRAMGGPEKRERERQYMEHYLPRAIDDAVAFINVFMPEGYEVVFVAEGTGALSHPPTTVPPQSQEPGEPFLRKTDSPGSDEGDAT